MPNCRTKRNATEEKNHIEICGRSIQLYNIANKDFNIFYHIAISMAFICSIFFEKHMIPNRRVIIIYKDNSSTK